MTEIWITRLFIISLVLNLILLAVIFIRKRTYRKTLNSITNDLQRILDQDTDEKLMFFTDDKALTALNMQINRMLNERQSIKAEYRASRLLTKRMLSNISHDIRTPMTVISGYIEMLLMNKSDDEETLKKVDGKVKQVTKLMEDFFTLTKLESGDSAVTLERVHCNEVCKSSILGFYDILSEKDFIIDIDIPKRDIFAYADNLAVERVLYNLISNAIRYGYEGNYLQMKLYENGNHVFIEVTDKGPGIDPTVGQQVFDRLYITEDTTNNRIQGNGLGLTIARQLSQKMGGGLTMESEPKVKTTFTLKLKKFKL